MFSAQVVVLTLLSRSRLLRLGCGLFRRRRLLGDSRLRLWRRRARWLGCGLLGLGDRWPRSARCRRRCRRGCCRCGCCGCGCCGCGRYGCGLGGLFRGGLFRSGSSSGFVVKLGNGALPMLLRPAIRTPFAFPNLVSTFFNLALIVMRHSLFPHRVFSRLQFSQKRQRYQPWHRPEIRRVGPASPSRSLASRRCLPCHGPAGTGLGRAVGGRRRVAKPLALRRLRVAGAW